MDKIKPHWKKHVLYKQGFVELIPIEWVMKIRGTDVEPYTDLMSGDMVDLEKLWIDLITNGMFEPFIVRVGLKNKKYRLETGNHRIQVMRAHNISHVPVAVQLQDECGPHAPNPGNISTHSFDVGDNVLITIAADEYMKPSAVFKDLRCYMYMRKTKQLIAGVVALLVAWFLYYTISPIFIKIRADEALPVATSHNATSTVAENLIATANYETAPKQLIDTPLHPASGTVRVVQSGPAHFLRYENFKTINGPDIYVYLSKDINATDFVNLGPVKATEGNVNYEIPAGVDPREYPYAIIWCEQFSALFNSALLYETTQ